MSKRLVDLSEAFDIIDWNISLLSLEQFVRISGSPLMISRNLGIGEGVVIHRIKSSWWGMGISPMPSTYPFPFLKKNHSFPQKNHISIPDAAYHLCQPFPAPPGSKPGSYPSLSFLWILEHGTWMHGSLATQQHASIQIRASPFKYLP